MSTFTNLLFTPAELIQFCAFAACVGGFSVKLAQLQKDQHELKTLVNKNHDDVTARQEKLELRHIAAVEKLGEALSEFAEDIRSKIGDHQSRINFLERTQE